MRTSGIVIGLIGAAFLLLNVGTIVYYMAVTGGWSLVGFVRQPFIDILAVTCIIAGVLIVRQSRRPPAG